MQWWAENTRWILIWGTVLALALAWAGLKTTRRSLLLAALVVIILAAALALWSHRVVTPREQVRDMIAELASAVESNDLERVVGLIAEDASALRAEAKRYMDSVVVREATIKSGLEISLTDADGTTAEARFPALVIVDIPSAGIARQRIPSRYVLYLRRDPQGWRVRSYERHDIR